MPHSVLNRGVGWQDLGILFSGTFGTGNGSSVSMDALLGKLVDISKRKAYGIIMFANIEKASPSVLEMIVSILLGTFKNRERMLVDRTVVLVLTKSNAWNDVLQIPWRFLGNAWKVKQILSRH